MQGRWFERGIHKAATFIQPAMDVRAVCHGDDFVFIGDEDGLEHATLLLQKRYTCKVMDTIGFEDGDDTSLPVFNRRFVVGTDAKGEYLDIWD